MGAAIAFVGAGSMASAMVDGLLAAGRPAEELICYSASGASAARLRERAKIRQSASLAELVAAADTVVIAFKPQHLAGADPQFAALTRGKLVVSVLAGKTLGALRRVFPAARNVVRTMPNTPSRIGAGMTGWCSALPLIPADRAVVQGLLDAMGRAVEVPESQMDALTGVSGSGPAYVFEFAAALRDAGVAAGLESNVAEALANQTILGAAKLLAARGVPAEVLRNEVTSPNGTTFAGLQRLAAGDFRPLMAAAVMAAKLRAEELSRD
jgi:pyrroline-5-carboxylate reductase